MLAVVPERALSRRFRVSSGEETVAELELAFLRDRLTLRVGATPWGMTREGWYRRVYALQDEHGKTVARAERPNAFLRRLSVRIEGRPYRLEAEAWLRRAFVLIEAGRTVGRLVPESLVSRRMRVELPASLPLPVQVFLAGIVLLEWRRTARQRAG